MAPALVLILGVGATAAFGAPPEPQDDILEVTAGLTTFRADLKPINSALGEASYSPISANATAAGFAFSMAFGSLQLQLCLDGLVGTRDSFGPAARELSVDQPTLSLGVGYAVYQVGVLRVLPTLAFVAGDLSLQLDAESPPLFADQLPDTAGRLTVSRDILGTDLALKTESVLPIWRAEAPAGSVGKTRLWLVVSTTLGYRVQLSPAGWRLDEAQGYLLTGGPELDLSGPFVRVSVGVGLPTP